MEKLYYQVIAEITLSKKAKILWLQLCKCEYLLLKCFIDQSINWENLKIILLYILLVCVFSFFFYDFVHFKREYPTISSMFKYNSILYYFIKFPLINTCLYYRSFYRCVCPHRCGYSSNSFFCSSNMTPYWLTEGCWVDYGRSLLTTM